MVRSRTDVAPASQRAHLSVPDPARFQTRPAVLLNPRALQTLTIFPHLAQERGLGVNGEEVRNITLLGKIIKASDTATNQVYTLDDGTGTVVVKQWVDADTQTRRPERMSSSWASALASTGTSSSSAATPPSSRSASVPSGPQRGHLPLPRGCLLQLAQRAAADAKPAAGTGTAYAAPSSAPASAPAVDPGGSCVDQAKAIFEGPDGRRDEGVKIDVVVQQLNGRFTEAQVREAVEHLVNEGHLYSTIDDDHFKSTNLLTER